MTERPFSIYTLSDPRTGEVRYVGLSNSAQRRYQEHIVSPNNASKRNWIRDLQANQLLPVLSIVESDLTMKMAKVRELAWIQYHLEQGSSLINISGVSKPWTGGISVGPKGPKPKPKFLPRKMVVRDELLTVNEVGQLLHVHPDYVRKLLREGKIPGEKVTGPGGRWRVRRSSVEKLTGGQQGTNSIQES